MIFNAFQVQQHVKWNSFEKNHPKSKKHNYTNNNNNIIEYKMIKWQAKLSFPENTNGE